MRKSTKLISALLVLVMVFSLLPISALAADQPDTVKAVSEALVTVLKDKVTKTIDDVTAVADPKEGYAVGFFGSVSKFLESIGVRQADYIGLFEPTDPEDAGNSILIEKVKTTDAEGKEVTSLVATYTMAVPEGEPIVLKGTAAMAEEGVKLYCACDEDKTNYFFNATLIKGENAVYTLTIDETGAGWTDLQDMSCQLVKAERQPVDVKEAGTSFYGLLANGSHLVTMVMGFVENLGVKGKILGVFEDIAIFDTALKDAFKKQAETQDEVFDGTYQLQDQAFYIVFDKNAETATFLQADNELLVAAVDVKGKVATLTGESFEATAVKGEDGTIAVTFANLGALVGTYQIATYTFHPYVAAEAN